MSTLETNIYPILNLDDFSARYRLYKVRGLARDDSEYYQNTQTLIRDISYALSTPAAVIESEDETFLVVRDDAKRPDYEYPLVRATVYLEHSEVTYDLNFGKLDARTEPIAMRFLQFMLQAPLSNSPYLWQPGSGRPFFEKASANTVMGVTRFTGFSVRVVRIDGGLGLCVDVANKYVRERPLPTLLTRPEFRPYKGQHCIYHYGHRWYEIQLREISELTASEEKVGDNGNRVPLLEFIAQQSQKPISQELAQLPPNASVVFYMNNRGQLRAAPAGLCYPVLDSADTARRNRPNALMKTEDRRGRTHRFVDRYLRSLRFSNAQLRLAAEPTAVPQKMFLLPDYEFGNGRRLSVRGTPGAEQVSLDTIGKMRLALLRDREAGFYVRDPLQRQYLILPQTVQDSFGPAFLKDLKAQLDELYPQEQPYDPIVVSYNDRVERTFVEQGNAILEAVRRHCNRQGFAVVMIHDTHDRRVRQHDQLAAMVIRKMREMDIPTAVMHSATGQTCYELRTVGGIREYVCRNEKRGKLQGYLRNVGLNKVLLTNERWPFVLATPLSAELTIGIDVKYNTAGFTVVNGKGNYIRTIVRSSNQKERLLAQQVRKMIVEVVTKEAETKVHSLPIRSLVIHRDGILWPTERLGVRKAIEDLKQAGILSPNAGYAMLEIPKSAPAPVRLYEVLRLSENQSVVNNPQVGTYYLLDDRNGYLCATGRAFSRPGTVKPVHVKYLEGTLPFVKCLEDVYFLTALAWTRPEDCTKHPITIKLTDRRLGEDAETFDSDALEYSAMEGGVTTS